PPTTADAGRPAGLLVRGQAPGTPVPPVPPPATPPPPPPPPPGAIGGEDPYNCGVVPNPAGGPPPPPAGGGFWDGLQGCVGGLFKPCDGRKPFQSDHAFDTFVSPT